MRPIARLQRVAGWPEALAAQVDAARRRPFAWGTHDCALWAADVVWAMTGRDLAGDWRGTYSTRRSAYARLAKMGGLEAVADAALGPSFVPVWAQRGDVVSVATPRGIALGVCLGVHAAFPGPSGLTFVEMWQCDRAWVV